MTFRKNITATTIISLWFIILVLGPYFPVLPKLPLRIDHFLFPLGGTFIWLYFCFKDRKIHYPKCLNPFLLFLGVAALSTILSVRTEEYYLNSVLFLAAVENMLRIVLIFLIAQSISNRCSINFKSLSKTVVFLGVITSFFGFYQVCQTPKWLHDIVEMLSIKMYTGRYGGSVSIVQLLFHIRSVSTFYLPGNFVLFLSIASVFGFLVWSVDVKSRVRQLIVLFPIILGMIFSGSKGIFVSVSILSTVLLFYRRWVLFIQFAGLLSLSIWLSSFIPAPSDVYPTMKSYLSPNSFVSLYNKALGPRFGIIKKKKNVLDTEKMTHQLSATSNKPKQEATTSIPMNLEAKSSDGSDVKILVSKKKKKKKKRAKGDGNLSESLRLIKSHPFIGLGFASNVQSGDSMFVNILVRGGFVGGILFFLFILSLMIKIFVRVKQKKISSSYGVAWITVCLIFCISGLAYPSFIQDRTGDVFWWLGACMLLTSPSTD